MESKAKILITGSTGLVGRALVNLLQQEQYELLTPSHPQLDLRNQTAVNTYFQTHQPHYVFHLAAVVGGIYANSTYPGKFIYDNTAMHCNVIHAAYQVGVKKLLFPGSACTYPKLAPQPVKESSFLEGAIESTNLAYAAAKINGIVMCQSYAQQYGFNTIIPMPTNAYGIGDNFDPNASHVIPALMQRFHTAKINKISEVVLWGSGTPSREFIHADDLADALLFLMEQHNTPGLINVGTMQEITILNLAKKIAVVVGYDGTITVDTTKPDGAPRKCLDSSLLFAMGWKHKKLLDQGLHEVYQHHFPLMMSC